LVFGWKLIFLVGYWFLFEFWVHFLLPDNFLGVETGSFLAIDIYLLMEIEYIFCLSGTFDAFLLREKF
jgi:hypothetical protein